MSKTIQTTQGINLNELASLAKANPKYASMFVGLAQIDKQIKKFVEDTIENQTDSSIYYVKTELMSQCYTLYLYSIERQAIVGVSWPLIDFLNKCETRVIEHDVIQKTKQMIDKFNQPGLSTGDKINWIY